MTSKSSSNSDKPGIEVHQTLWSCATEAVSEYCRIVWDIFGMERNVTFVINHNGKVRSLNNWSEQGMEVFMKNFAHLGPPPATPPSSPDVNFSNQLDAIKLAVTKISETHPKDDPKKGTRGRIVFLGCITNDILESNKTTQSSINSAKWRKELGQIIKNCNEKAVTRSNMLNLNELEILLVDLKNSKVINQENKIVADAENFKLELCHVEAGLTETSQEFQLSTKMTQLAMHHHRLMKTTISGIPMKEEQSNTQNKESQNYDVPLLHQQLGNSTETLILKWNSPKVDLTQLHPCSSAVRISPLEVNLRHSDCLTKFLTSGRSVLLEGANKEPGTAPQVSHMLSCHGGDIYLHKRQGIQNNVTEPPALADGPGGQRIDYRVSELRSLMKDYLLFPSLTPSKDKIRENGIQLERETRVWPLVNSDSALYSLPGTSFGHILKLIVQPNLSDPEKIKVLEILRGLREKEREGQRLPWSTGGRGGKTPRLNDYYKKLWQEMCEFLEAHSNNSPNHRSIYEDFLAQRGKNSNSLSSKRRQEGKDNFDEPENKIRNFGEDQSAPISLFEMFLAKEKQIPDRRFYGQQTTHSKVELYPKMGGETDQTENLRKDASDALENKADLDTENKKFGGPSLMPPSRNKPNFEREKSASLNDPRMRDHRQRDPRDPRDQGGNLDRLDRQRSANHDQRFRHKWN